MDHPGIAQDTLRGSGFTSIDVSRNTEIPL
jgi:hypothetical protein